MLKNYIEGNIYGYDTVAERDDNEKYRREDNIDNYFQNNGHHYGADGCQWLRDYLAC